MSGRAGANGRYPVAWWLFPAIFWLLAVLVVALSQPARGRSGNATPGPVNEGRLLTEISRRPALSFGFSTCLSDIVWLQAVQAAAPIRMLDADYERLYLLLDAVVHFDPRFRVPYLVGGITLGDSPAHAGQALTLLARGHRYHPDKGEMLYYTGYIRYFILGDPIGGGEALQAAAKIPGSPPYLPFLAARMLSEGRAPRTAISFLSAMIEEEKDPARQERLERRLQEVIVERDIQQLEGAIGEFRKRTGRNPSGLEELVRERIIGAIPREPFGGRYRLSPEGKVSSDRLKTRMRVFRP